MGTKVCKTCEVEKPLDEYHRHRGRPDGRQGSCKVCQRRRVRKGRDRSAAKARAEYRADRERRRRRAIRRVLDEHETEYEVYLAEEMHGLRRPEIPGQLDLDEAATDA